MADNELFGNSEQLDDTISRQAAKDENGKIIAWNDPRTAIIRSKTFPGIAKAMAEQWG